MEDERIIVLVDVSSRGLLVVALILALSLASYGVAIFLNGGCL